MLFEVPICGFDMCMLFDTGPTLDFLLKFGCLVDPLRIPLKYHHGETLPQTLLHVYAERFPEDAGIIESKAKFSNPRTGY